VRRAAFGAVLAVLTLGAAGCGGEDRRAPLTWQGKPQVFRLRSLPRDRVVIARVRNTTDKTLHLVASKLVVRDADGHALNGSSAGFTTTFTHGLFGAYQQPDRVPPAELLRLGKAVYIPAGASVPFYAAWRLAPGTPRPIRIDYGPGTIEVPDGPVRTASG
jgi:hypothetical protein